MYTILRMWPTKKASPWMLHIKFGFDWPRFTNGGRQMDTILKAQLISLTARGELINHLEVKDYLSSGQLSYLLVKF